jgi:nucleoside-specific outer membrane channel protein Tsx
VSWETLSPTVVAHTVQRNADPDYYTQYWHKAVAVVTALNRTVPPSIVLPSPG